MRIKTANYLVPDRILPRSLKLFLHFPLSYRSMNGELGEQIEDLAAEMVLPSISYVLMYG